jgi:hypothetical protein
VAGVWRDGCVETTEGLREFDIIIWATGWDFGTGALNRLGVRGRDGLALEQYWAEGPRTYLGIMTAGFPNFFFLLGPNTGLGHNWPAGGGPGGSYISTNSIDYPAYVTEFFFENNRRTGPLPTEEPTPTDPSTPTEEPTQTEEPTTGAEQCVTASNADHRSAGRATSYGVNPYNPYYAVGSQDYLGQGDSTVTSLHGSSDGVFDLVPSC